METPNNAPVKFYLRNSRMWVIAPANKISLYHEVDTYVKSTLTIDFPSSAKMYIKIGNSCEICYELPREQKQDLKNDIEVKSKLFSMAVENLYPYLRERPVKPDMTQSHIEFGNENITPSNGFISSFIQWIGCPFTEDRLEKGEYYQIKCNGNESYIFDLKGNFITFTDKNEYELIKKVPTIKHKQPLEKGTEFIKLWPDYSPIVVVKEDAGDLVLVLFCTEKYLSDNRSVFDSQEMWVTRVWLMDQCRPKKYVENPEWIKEGTLLFRPATKNCSASVSYISSIWWEGLDDDNEPRLHLKDPKTGSFYNPMLSEVLEYCYPIGIFKDFYGNDRMDDDEYDTED